jgi:hypothetical protein
MPPGAGGVRHQRRHEGDGADGDQRGSRCAGPATRSMRRAGISWSRLRATLGRSPATAAAARCRRRRLRRGCRCPPRLRRRCRLRRARCVLQRIHVVDDGPALDVRHARAVRGHAAATGADDGVHVAVGRAEWRAPLDERTARTGTCPPDDGAIAAALHAVADGAVPLVHDLAERERGRSSAASGFWPHGPANAFSACSVPPAAAAPDRRGDSNGTDPGAGGSGCSYGSNDGALRMNAKIGTDASASSIRVQPGSPQRCQQRDGRRAATPAGAGAQPVYRSPTFTSCTCSRISAAPLSRMMSRTCDSLPAGGMTSTPKRSDEKLGS